MVKEIIKKIFFKYQQFMWYTSQAGNEISKPLRFYSETLLLITALGIYGIKFTISQILLFYIFIILIAGMFGIFITRIGVVKYNQTLSNEQNVELQKIIKKLNAPMEVIRKR